MFASAPNNLLRSPKDIKTYIYVIFEIILDSQEVAETKLKEISLCPSPSVTILSNYNSISKEGNQHYTVHRGCSDFPSLYWHLFVCVYMCVVLCNFFTRVDLCNHYKLLVLYFKSKNERKLPIFNKWMGTATHIGVHTYEYMRQLHSYNIPEIPWREEQDLTDVAITFIFSWAHSVLWHS